VSNKHAEIRVEGPSKVGCYCARLYSFGKPVIAVDYASRTPSEALDGLADELQSLADLARLMAATAGKGSVSGE
jgi:hypothetical protein